VAPSGWQVTFSGVEPAAEAYPAQILGIAEEITRSLRQSRGDIVGFPAHTSSGVVSEGVQASNQLGWSEAIAMVDSTSTLRVRSYRWKLASLSLLVVGYSISLGLASAILQIDGAAMSNHFTPSQDAVGITAFVVGIAGLVGTIVVAVRWWRRPALEVTPETVTVYKRRPVAVPWPMISHGPACDPGPGLERRSRAAHNRAGGTHRGARFPASAAKGS
jgi:hypothetical protein